jgi:hypothetical protein
VFVIELVPIPKLPEEGLKTNFDEFINAVEIDPLLVVESVGYVKTSS